MYDFVLENPDIAPFGKCTYLKTGTRIDGVELTVTDRDFGSTFHHNVISISMSIYSGGRKSSITKVLFTPYDYGDLEDPEAFQIIRFLWRIWRPAIESSVVIFTS